MDVKIAQRMAFDNYEPSESDLVAYQKELEQIHDQSLARKALEYGNRTPVFMPRVMRFHTGRVLRKALPR